MKIQLKRKQSTIVLIFGSLRARVKRKFAVIISYLFILFSLFPSLYSLFFILYSLFFPLYSSLFIPFALFPSLYSSLFILPSLFFPLYSFLFIIFSIFFPLLPHSFSSEIPTAHLVMIASKRKRELRYAWRRD
jgi:hypothetical protein